MGLRPICKQEFLQVDIPLWSKALCMLGSHGRCDVSLILKQAILFVQGQGESRGARPLLMYKCKYLHILVVVGGIVAVLSLVIFKHSLCLVSHLL